LYTFWRLNNEVNNEVVETMKFGMRLGILKKKLDPLCEYITDLLNSGDIWVQFTNPDSYVTIKLLQMVTCI